MDFYDSFLISARVLLHRGDVTAILAAITAFLLCFLGFGLFWGLMWNRKWSLLGHLASSSFSVVFALLVSAIVLGLFGAVRTPQWIETEREILARQLVGSGSVNREAFRIAWERLQPLGGQEGLTPPAQGGNEIRLSNASDAKILARAAAEAVKRPLMAHGPFASGVPAFMRDPETVAEDVVTVIAAPSYPVMVSPDNEWSRAAVTAQVGAAIDSAAKQLRQPLAELTTVLYWALGIVFFLQIGMTALNACRDIREHPKV